MTAVVHYELYDGLPLLAKWVTVQASKGRKDIRVGVVSPEILHLNHQWSEDGYGWLWLQTDEPHGNVVNWGKDEGADQLPGSFQPKVNATYGREFE